MRYCPLIQLDRETILNPFQLWIYVVKAAKGLVYMCLTADCLTTYCRRKCNFHNTYGNDQPFPRITILIKLTEYDL